MRQVPKLRIFAVILSAELGNNILVPLLAFLFFAANSPLFAIDPGMARRSLLFGLCLSLSKLGEILANTVITTLSDHLGRKIAIYGTFAGLLILAGGGISGLALHSPVLMISSVFLCNVLNTNKAIGPAIMGDISTADNRIAHMATIQGVIATGACLGPILGGQLANRSLLLTTAYSLPFLMIAIIAALGMALTARCPETLVIQRATKILQDYWQLLKSQSVRRLFYLLILCQVSWSSYYEFISPTLKNIFHYSPSQVGLFVGLVAFWLIIAATVMIRLLLRVANYQQLLWISSVAVAAGTLLALVASENPAREWSQSALWLSAVPTAMGDVIFFSLFTAFLSHQVGAGQQGKAMGLTLIVANLVWSVTALVGGGLLTLHPNGALLFAPLGAIALLLVLPLFSRRYSDDFMS